MHISSAIYMSATLAATYATVAKAEEHIPLQRSSSLRLTHPDGTIAMDALKQTVEFTKEKYLGTRLAYQDNHGGQPMPGVPKLTRKEMEKVGARMKAKRQKEALTPQGGALWTGPIQIGNQQFNIDFDTGSSDLWVPSTNCPSYGCSRKNRYNNVTNPATKTYPSQRFSISYADGSGVSGPVLANRVSVAGIAVNNQNFSAVTQMMTTLDDANVDGILGMAYASISRMRSLPVFQNTWANNRTALGSNLFSFALTNNPTGSEICWGCINSNKYSGQIYYNKVNQQAYWRIGSGSINSNSKTVATNQNMIIDSGTTLIYAPNATVAAIFSNAPGARYYQDGYWTVPCNRVPTIAFKFPTGPAFPISSANLILGSTSEDRNRCVVSIIGESVIGDDILVGDAFMKNVYTVFSLASNSVGFATLPGVTSGAAVSMPRLTRPTGSAAVGVAV